MKHIFIAGNWKSNKTIQEASLWVTGFTTLWTAAPVLSDSVTVVVLPPYLALPSLREHFTKNSLPISLGAQDVSPFDAGAYTGEISASMVKEVADWVIIGHSERRKHFNETDDTLFIKTEKARASGLRVIYCVPDAETRVPAGVDVVAYEPVWAIGTGKTDTPENARAVIASIKLKTSVQTVIYGGSVTAKNVESFVAQDAIDGVLPGGASLDPSSFYDLIRLGSTLRLNAR